jgi:glycosyltransferase involved in cell wall biosynthesis
LIGYKPRVPTGRPLVLIDATPLRADSGFRGIGRYIRDLLYGLAQTRGDWEATIRVAALDELSLSGRAHVSEDLVQSADAAFAARGSEGAALKYARRAVLGRVAERHDARLLHLTEAVGTPFRCPTPRLLTCHDLIELRYPKQYLGGPIRARLRLMREQRRYGSAEHIVAISQRTANDAIEIAGVRPERVHVVLHGVDLETFSERADERDDHTKLSELGLSGIDYVVYAGGADWRKNVEGMARALAVARRNVNVELVWAGALQPRYVSMVRRIARSHGVDGSVRFLGFVPESHMPALFRNARAHLFISRLEGFGLSVVEAMAVGCPVIVARGSCSDEIAAEGGIVVDPDDPEAAGKAILELVVDPNARKRQAELGRARVPYFDRVRMARDYAALYAELVLGRALSDRAAQ